MITDGESEKEQVEFINQHDRPKVDFNDMDQHLLEQLELNYEQEERMRWEQQQQQQQRRHDLFMQQQRILRQQQQQHQMLFHQQMVQQHQMLAAAAAAAAAIPTYNYYNGFTEDEDELNFQNAYYSTHSNAASHTIPPSYYPNLF